MKFLCDVHISYKVKKFLLDQGFEALHVNEILNGDKTDDISICRYCDENGLTLITKDFDFVDYFYLKQTPARLIKVNLGNISVDLMLALLKQYLPLILKIADKKKFLIEIDKNNCFISEEG